MQSHLRIGVLHYHLLHGGVRTVIVNALRALIAHGGYDSLEIDLITSDARHKGGDKLAVQLLDWARGKGPSQFRLSQFELSRLAYNQKPAPDRNSLFEQAEGIKKRLIEIMELNRSDYANPYILHVHNGNLGKNPYLTLALKLLADWLDEEKPPARIIYQMHDFAEASRPDCWNALRRCSGRSDPQLAVEMMYPVSGQVHWVCINSADKQALISTGIRPECVSVLPNCVAVETFTAGSVLEMSDQQLRQLHLEPMDFAEDLRNRIASFAQKNGYHFDPSRKILLSPVKAIRRKNVAESILLLMVPNAGEDCYQLLVTLPANSSKDVAYCRKIERFVKQYRLPVVMGFGTELLQGGQHRIIENGKVLSYSLIDMMALSEAVVTTSIKEGFGYVFHEPWLADKMVFGRNIGQITRDFTDQGLKLDHLYDHLLIPLEWLNSRWDNIRQAYTRKIKQLHRAMGVSPPAEHEIRGLFEQKKIYNIKKGPRAEKMADWADLDLDTQLFVLKSVMENPPLIGHIQGTNFDFSPITDWLAMSKSDIIGCNREVVSTKYNLENQASRLSSLFGKGGRSLMVVGEPMTSRAITNELIFQYFLKLENMRLLA